MQIEMVWAHNKINRTGKDDPEGHGTGREKERQTEKEMARQHTRMDRMSTERNEEKWLPDHP